MYVAFKSFYGDVCLIFNTIITIKSLNEASVSGLNWCSPRWKLILKARTAQSKLPPSRTLCWSNPSVEEPLGRFISPERNATLNSMRSRYIDISLFIITIHIYKCAVTILIHDYYEQFIIFDHLSKWKYIFTHLKWFLNLLWTGK